MIAEGARIPERKRLKLVPSRFVHCSVRFEEPVEHVVVEANENAVLRLANVDFVAVAAQFEGGAIGFERVLVGEFVSAPMADDHGLPASLRYFGVALLRLCRRFCRALILNLCCACDARGQNHCQQHSESSHATAFPAMSISPTRLVLPG